MSLETTIADLVSAANNLTDAVNGKMSEIDAKVTNVADSFANEIRSSIGAIYYVDQQSGNDLNSGTSADEALLTLDAAADKMIPGGAYIVYLRSDYILDHVEMRPPANALVRIQGLKPDGSKAVVTSTYNPDKESTGGYLVIGSFNQTEGCSFFFKDIEVRLNIDGADAETTPFFGRQCLIRTNAGTSPSTRMDIQFDDCDLTQFLDQAQAHLDGGGTVDIHVIEMQTNVVGLILKGVAVSAVDATNKARFVRDRDMSSVTDKIVSSNNVAIFRAA